MSPRFKQELRRVYRLLLLPEKGWGQLEKVNARLHDENNFGQLLILLHYLPLVRACLTPIPSSRYEDGNRALQVTLQRR